MMARATKVFFSFTAVALSLFVFGTVVFGY